jgi:hypothetical protein
MKRRGFIGASIFAAAETFLAQLPSIAKALPDQFSLHSQLPNPRGLKVSTNGRFLSDAETGHPFFLLADTVWNLNALTYQEIDLYLRDRSSHGFSAFMFCLNFFPQAASANAYGQRAYIGPDNTALNPLYFEYCDYILRAAARYGLYGMVYAMWAGKTAGTMNTYTAAQLHSIGLRVGARLRDHDNVILIAGGESSPPHIDAGLVDSIGSGLKAGCGGKHLVTVHPCGNHSCSQYYSRSPWLDFYMVQGSSSRHGSDYDMTALITHDYNNNIVRPTMIAENYYESGTTQPPTDQRRGLYLSVFAGAFGCGYGHDALWQMSPHTAQKWMLDGWPPGVSTWKDALDTQAAKQLHYITDLLYSRPFFTRIPDQSLIVSGQGQSIADRIQATRDGLYGNDDATYIMAYLAAPASVTLNTAAIACDQLNAWWFTPATGRSTPIKMNFANSGKLSLEEQPGEPDAVVVVDSVANHYPPPARAIGWKIQSTAGGRDNRIDPQH